MAGALVGALLTKIRGRPGRGRQVVIDNFCFRLHYKATFYLLIGLGLFITGRHYIDHQINCHPLDRSTATISSDALNNYCWIHGTYNRHSTFVVEQPNGGDTKGKKAQTTKAPNGTTHRNDYYQWVSLFLLAQSVFFYLPHWLWRQLEGGYLNYLVETFGNCNNGLDTSWNVERPPTDLHAERRGRLVDFLRRHFGSHSFYGYSFVVCEVLNLVNVCGQLLLTDYFLGGNFLGYGWRVLTWREHTQHRDPQQVLFPTVATCTYHRFADTGRVSTFDAICFLPNNVVNSKAFLLINFWLTAVIAISAAAILYRFLLILFPHFRWTRRFFLSRFSSDSQSSRRLVTSCKSVFRKMSPRLYGADFSDWLVIYYLCKNVRWIDYYQLMDDLDTALHVPSHHQTAVPPGAPPMPPLDENSYFDQNINCQSFPFQPNSCNSLQAV